MLSASKPLEDIGVLDAPDPVLRVFSLLPHAIHRLAILDSYRIKQYKANLFSSLLPV